MANRTATPSSVRNKLAGEKAQLMSASEIDRTLVRLAHEILERWHLRGVCGFLLILLCNLSLAQGQKSDTLLLTRKIALPAVRGGFNHMSIDDRDQRLFVPAPRDGILEIVDVRSGRFWRSLTAQRPTAALYAPEFGQLYLTSGKSVYIYNAKTFHTVARLNLQTRLDQLRYDPQSRRLYVGCMGQKGGTGIAVISIPDGKLQWKVALPDSPQGIAVERNGIHIFANLPDLNSIAVIDRRERKVVANWTLGGADANFPIAFDQSGHRLFVACRRPPEMLVLDSRTGRTIARVPCVGDADDIWYDASGERIYITGGEGSVSVIQKQTADQYRLLEQVATAPGAATSVLSRELNSLFVGVPGRENQPSEILVYDTAN